MSDKHIIVNKDDFNNAVDVIGELSTTLFESKKELEQISKQININSVDLNEKLNFLDIYITKIATIQKVVLSEDTNINAHLNKILAGVESRLDDNEELMVMQRATFSASIQKAKEDFKKINDDFQNDLLVLITKRNSILNPDVLIKFENILTDTKDVLKERSLEEKAGFGKLLIGFGIGLLCAFGIYLFPKLNGIFL